MTEPIIVGIYRIQDLSYESFPKESIELVKLHNIRKEALHDIFDHQKVAEVKSWGDTDDTTSHEYVELILGMISSAVIQPVISYGLKKLGEKLVEHAIDESTSAFIKWVAEKLTKKAKEKKIADFQIRASNKATVQVIPSGDKVQIKVSFKGGEWVSIESEKDN